MKKKELYLDLKILDWWIDWHRENSHYFCALIQLGDRKVYIERELEQT